MPKYMVQFSYTEEGLKGLLKEGGSKRKEAVEQLVTSLGGKLEAFYYCFGEYDGVAIVEGTDNITQTAGALIIAASGATTLQTTVLITPEEVDKAVAMSGPYRPPGR